MGEFDGSPVVFLGAKRPGFVAVSAHTVTNPYLYFQTLFYAGGFADPWEDMYQEVDTKILEPKDLV